jgi:tetratricopeptide (TPR) repeat protein/AraC-like DNA-binding protein
VAWLYTADQQFISKLTEIILENLRNEKFGVGELANLAGMSRSGLNLKLHRLINKNVNQFIREVRLQRALEMLQNEDVTASEVAYKVGFSSPAYFNTCFHEFFGLSPGHVKRNEIEKTEESGTYPITIKKEHKLLSRSTLFSKLYLILFLAIVILTTAVLLYIRMLSRNTLSEKKSADKRTSVAVMPFQNMTDDITLNIWQIGIQNNLISFLSKNPEDLRVLQPGSIINLIRNNGISDYVSIPPKVVLAITRKLEANVLIYGSINQSDTIVRINTQLLNSRTGEILQSFQTDGSSKKILVIIDTLSGKVKNFLVLSKLLNEDPSYNYGVATSTLFPEAYEYFKYGEKALAKTNYQTATDMFTKAIAIDSNYVYPALSLCWTYLLQGMYDEGRRLCLKTYLKKNQMPRVEKSYTEIVHSYLFETPNETMRHISELREIDDQTPYSYYLMGNCYIVLQQYQKAIPEYERSLEIYKKRGINPFYVSNYTDLSLAYFKTGQLSKAKKLLKKAEQDFPDNISVIGNLVLLELFKGDTVKANEYSKRCILLNNESTISYTDLTTTFASIYTEAGMTAKAEEYLRQAMRLEPRNPVKINNLAYFLIDNELNVYEGLQLVNKSLALNPDDYLSLDCKGWGAYKMGRYEEALELLEKSWNLKPVYNHRIYLHLEEVRKKVSGK